MASNERRSGRRQGEGWYLEDETHAWLVSMYWAVSTRVHLWNVEVDLVARREDEAPPYRLVISCKDWFTKERITPCDLWRLIGLALTLRGEPMLVHNTRVELTSRAQHIAEAWRIRLVTDDQVGKLDAIPAPERPNDSAGAFPQQMWRELERKERCRPDYYHGLGWDLPPSKLERAYRD